MWELAYSRRRLTIPRGRTESVYVFGRRARAHPAAERENEAMVAGLGQDTVCRFPNLFGRPESGNFQRIHIPHQRHAPADSRTGFAHVDVLT